MTDININEVYEELKYLGELPETSRLIKDYLALREENEKLRSRVKELADAVDNDACHNCKHGSERCGWCGTVQELDALVNKAMEVSHGE